MKKISIKFGFLLLCSFVIGATRSPKSSFSKNNVQKNQIYTVDQLKRITRDFFTVVFANNENKDRFLSLVLQQNDLDFKLELGQQYWLIKVLLNKSGNYVDSLELGVVGEDSIKKVLYLKNKEKLVPKKIGNSLLRSHNPRTDYLVF